MELQQKISRSMEKLEAIISRLELQKKIEESYDAEMDEKINNQNFDSIFEKNLSVFKQYMPETYQEIINYTPEKFHFQLSSSGDVNIFNQEEEKFYYGSTAYASSLSQYMAFSRYPSSISAVWNREEDSIEDFCNSTYMNKMIHYFDIARENSREKCDEDPTNEISAMIVLGIGLGLHLDMIATNMTLRSLFVYEPEFDVFYASLYVNDWGWIFRCLMEKNINFHLSLGISAKDFAYDFGRQMHLNMWHENVVTHIFNHAPGKQFKETLKCLSDSFHHYFIGFGFFDDALLGVAHQFENLKRNVRLLPSKNENNPEFQDIPVFVVLNGPSLDSSIEIIRKYQDKAVIVAGGTTLSALYSYGIKPDVFVSMERSYSTFELLKRSCSDEYRKNVLLLTLNVIHPETFDLFDDSAIIFKTGETATDAFIEATRKDNGDYPVTEAQATNPTVCNLISSWLLKLGFKHCYLFGADLSDVGNQHHSEQSIYYDPQGNDLELFDISKEDKIEVEANFGGSVFASPFFNTSRRVLEGLLTIYPDTRWFNTSQGAKIAGTEPLPSDEILLNKNIDKKAIKKAIKSKFVPSNSFLSSTDFVESLDIEQWKRYADHLVEFCDGAPNVSSRNEAAMFMRLHWDLVNLEGLPAHFANTFTGTFHYQQSVIYSTLYIANNDIWKELFCNCYSIFKDSLAECRARLDTHIFKCSYARLAQLPGMEEKLNQFSLDK